MSSGVASFPTRLCSCLWTYLLPPVLLLGLDCRRLVHEDHSIGQQIEQCAFSSGVGVKLPARKDRRRRYLPAHAADCVAFTFQPGAGKPCMDFVSSSSRTGVSKAAAALPHPRRKPNVVQDQTCGWIQLVAEQLNAQRSVSFRRIGIQQAATDGVLPRHLHHSTAE